MVDVYKNNYSRLFNIGDCSVIITTVSIKGRRTHGQHKCWVNDRFHLHFLDGSNYGWTLLKNCCFDLPHCSNVHCPVNDGLQQKISFSCLHAKKYKPSNLILWQQISNFKVTAGSIPSSINNNIYISIQN